MPGRDLLCAVYTRNHRMEISTDFGRSWSDVTPHGNVLFNEILRVPNGSRLFAYGSGFGNKLFISTDAGKSWSSVFGAVSESAHTARISPQGHLTVSTISQLRGHFLWRNAAALTSAGELPAAEQPHLTVWPQPARDYIHAAFPMDAEGAACVVRDMLGRTVLSPSVQDLRSGRIATHMLPTGQYFLVLRNRGETSIGRFVIQR